MDELQEQNGVALMASIEAAALAHSRIVEEPAKTPKTPEYTPQGDYDINVILPQPTPTPNPTAPAKTELTPEQKRVRLIILLCVLAFMLIAAFVLIKLRK